MDIAKQFEQLVTNSDLEARLASIQDIRAFQEQYRKLVVDGVITKRSYDLAPVNVLGASIPGQTTFKLNF